jgi:hypothetical protein
LPLRIFCIGLISRNRTRTRGANFTSADAAVMFKRKDGLIQIVLIEWKYTESYYTTSLKISASGTDRTEIYRPLFDQPDCPVNKSLLPNFDDLFYEPFYQLFRQQMLADQMEKVKELGASIVSVLHIAPAHNKDFGRVTSPNLTSMGHSVPDVWKKLLIRPDRFTSVSTESLFGNFPAEQFPGLDNWWEFINKRYSWLRTP